MKTFKKILKYLFLILLWAIFLFMGTGPPAKWSYFINSGVKGESPSDYIEFVREKASERNIGNLAVILIEDGKIADETYSSISEPVDGNTLFKVASISKWITTWAILHLAEEGRLNLDIPVNNYLTRWKLTSEYYDVEEVTIRSLLTHQSGLNREYEFKDNTILDSVPSIEDALSVAEFIHEPNTAYAYSNIGFGILQLVIEEVTDIDFNSYIEERVMRPLGMEKSTFVYQDSSKHELATFYNTDNTRSPHFRYAEQAATSLYTTPNELSNFLLAHIKGNPVLKKESIDLLNTYYFSDGGYFGQGLGVRIYDTTIDNHTMIGHNGLGRWAINSAAIIDLGSNDGIIVFCNGSMDFAKYLGNVWMHWNKGIVNDSVQFENLNKMIMLFVLGALLIIIIGFVLERRKNTSDRHNVKLQ